MHLDNLLIFQIGFNKCGTRSLYNFFSKNGIPSLHWEKGQIARSMFKNSRQGKKLISSCYRKINFFSDMEDINNNSLCYVAQDLFKKLAEQYPNAYFILNTRNKEKWIQSRINHRNYLKKVVNILNITPEQVINKWGNDWDNHLANVRSFFKDTPDRLVEYNIETEDINKISAFLKNAEGLTLQNRHYVKFGKTNSKKKFNLTLCAIFRDEGLYLEEWLAFHLKQGIEHFFLYNNHLHLDEKSKVTLRKYKSVITVIPFNAKICNRNKSIQRCAYDNCLKTFGKRADWIIFLDVDEFVFNPTGAHIKIKLNPHVPYVRIGTSGTAKVNLITLHKDKKETNQNYSD
jgi:hypothetical protein